MKKKEGSLKSTIAVSLTNYLDAGAIVAGASGLTLWKDYLGLTEGHLGWLNAISANCLGAAIGAIIGGFLADKYGRKAIYTYNMLVYMLGVALILCSVSFQMLLAGFLVTGISVGVGVPASWTYISESSEVGNRGRNIGISQMAWGIGPTIILILGTLLAPPTGGAGTEGVLFGFVGSVAALFGVTSGAALNVFSSRIVFTSLFIVAFIAWLLQRRLEESKEWENMRTATTTQPAATSTFSSFGSLFTDMTNIRTMLFLAGMYLQWLIIIATTFVFSMIVDKVNQRWLYCLGVSFAVAAWLLILTVGINSIAGLLIFTLLWGLQGGISVQSFYALWASELFPAKYRAAAQGVMFFIVRGLSAAWGLGFVYIYGEQGEGFTMAAWVMLSLLLVSLVIGTVGAPNTRGKTLEQITKERYKDPS